MFRLRIPSIAVQAKTVLANVLDPRMLVWREAGQRPVPPFKDSHEEATAEHIACYEYDGYTKAIIILPFNDVGKRCPTL